MKARKAVKILGMGNIFMQRDHLDRLWIGNQYVILRADIKLGIGADLVQDIMPLDPNGDPMRLRAYNGKLIADEREEHRALVPTIPTLKKLLTGKIVCNALSPLPANVLGIPRELDPAVIVEVVAGWNDETTLVRGYRLTGTKKDVGVFVDMKFDNLALCASLETRVLGSRGTDGMHALLYGTGPRNLTAVVMPVRAEWQVQ